MLKFILAQLFLAHFAATMEDPSLDIHLNTQFKAEVTRLQCEHLRTLCDRLIGELTTLEQGLATVAHPDAVLVDPFGDGITKQSELIVDETARLQSYVQSLVSPGPETGAGIINPDVHKTKAKS